MSDFLETRRRHGTLRMLHEVIYRLTQRLMTLDITHLMRVDRGHVTPRALDSADFTFRLMTPDEVRELAHSHHDLTIELADRLELENDFCFAAFSGDQLAAYGWYALHSIEAEHNRGGALETGVAMSFPETMAFMYKGFTQPEFRGLGLYGQVNARALEALAPHGVTTLISTADWVNWSALNSCWRLGYQDLGLVCKGGWGQLLFTRGPRKAKPLGIHIGPQALVHARQGEFGTVTVHA